MPREQTRALVEGAFFASLTAMFALINIFIPLFSLLIGLIGPMPLAVLVKRYDIKVAFLSLAVAVMITVFLYGNPLAALLFTFQIGLLGILLGLLLKKNISAGSSIVFSAMGSLLLTVFSFSITFIITGINPFDIGNEIRHTVEEIYKAYQNSGAIANLDSEELRLLEEQVIETVTIFLPGSIAIWSLITGGVSYLATRELFRRLKYDVVYIKAFSSWQFPWYSTWSIILGLGLLLFGDNLQVESLSIVAKNILYISCFVFAVLGLSVAVFYIKKFPFSKIIKFIIVVMSILYWPFTMVILLVFGIMDPFINFRRIGCDKDK